jgi:hypothetical protein
MRLLISPAFVELVGAARVVGIEEHQLHVPLVEGLHLLHLAEPEEVLLEAQTLDLAGALLFHLHRSPVGLA